MELYDRRGDDIPEGWGCDAQGKLSTDPKRVLNGGGLVPIGGSEATGWKRAKTADSSWLLSVLSSYCSSIKKIFRHSAQTRISCVKIILLVSSHIICVTIKDLSKFCSDWLIVSLLCAATTVKKGLIVFHVFLK